MMNMQGDGWGNYPDLIITQGMLESKHQPVPHECAKYS